MKRKALNLKKISSLVLAGAMMTASALPTGVFAAETNGYAEENANVPVVMNLTAPAVEKAVVVNKDGTAATVGDEIWVYFNANTNMSTDGTLSGVLDGATYSWEDAQTLKIVLGTTSISTSSLIDISAIGIKDESGAVNATGLTDIPLNDGGFGHAIKPEIVRVSAVSVTGNPTSSTGDKIVIAFNTLVDHTNVTVDDISVTGGNLGNGATLEWQDGETSVAIITLGASMPDVVVNETAIRFECAIWDISGTTKLASQDYKVSHGAWGVTITPELMSATIVKVSDKPTAQVGDKVVFVFTTPTNSPQNVTALFGDKFGTGATGEWSSDGTIYTLTLGTNPTITDGSEITFTNDGNLKDYYNVKSVPNKSELKLQGSFGKANKPELISATIIKTAVEPKAQTGDKIALVFSAMTNGKSDIVSLLGDKFGTGATGEWSAKGTVYTITLGNAPTITDDDTITLTENSDFMDIHEIVTVKGGTAVRLYGTFGEEIVQDLQVHSVIAYSEGSKNKVKVIFNVETNLTTVANSSFKTALGEANKVDNKCIFGETFDIDVTAQELIITLDNTGYFITDETVLNLAGLGIKSASGGELTGTIPTCDGYFVPVVTNVAVADDGVTVVVCFSARTDGNTEAAKAAVLAQKALFGSTANENVEWKNNNTELHITMSEDNTMADEAYIVLNNFEIYDEFSKTHKVVGQYNVDTEKLVYKTISFTVYANAINTENAARTDVTKALEGDELIIEFSHATDTPDNMIENIALENEGDTFGDGATAVWSSDKKLAVTLGANPVITTSSKVIVKNVKFANGMGKLSQDNADVSEPVAITGKFDGREYWIGSATKASANGRTRITVDIVKSPIATDTTNIFAVCQAYNSRNTVETISAIGVPNKATHLFVFDFNAANFADFDVLVLKGDYSDINAGVDIYSDTVKPTAAE